MLAALSGSEPPAEHPELYGGGPGRARRSSRRSSAGPSAQPGRTFRLPPSGTTQRTHRVGVVGPRLRRPAAGARVRARRAARWSASTADSRRVEAINSRREPRRGRRRRPTWPRRSRPGACAATTQLRRARGGGRDRDLRPDAADREPPARPRARGRRRHLAVARAAHGAARRARVDDLPGHDPRAARAAARGVRASPRAATSTSPTRPSGSIPGRSDFTLRNTVKVVGGLTRRRARRAARELYERVCDEVLVVSTPEAAELAKLLENIFRSVNIALVNELAVLCDRMGIDIWEVIDAAATKPFGFMRFDPGPGMGGHCLPVDPFYLAWQAREFDFYTEFIELAGKINQSMPYFCVDKIERTLNDHGQGRCTARASCCSASSYKPGVGDTARVARAEDPEAARRARRATSPTTTRTSRRCRRRGLESAPLDAGARGGRPGRDRDRAPGDRLPPRGRRTRGWCSTSAASRAGSSPPTWCACEAPAADSDRDRRRGRASATGARTWRATSPRSRAASCAGAATARAEARERWRARVSRHALHRRPRRPARGRRARRGRGRDRRAVARARSRSQVAGGRQALLRREAAGAVGRGGRRRSQRRRPPAGAS